MKILLDTNIVLDILLERKEFINDSLSALTKAISNGDRIYLSSSAATDIYYVIRRQTGNKDEALKGIKKISEILSFADVNEECVLKACKSKITDFEDAVVDEVASNIKVDYIITRNIKDYNNSKNKILTPKEYINIYDKISRK